MNIALLEYAAGLAQRMVKLVELLKSSDGQVTREQLEQLKAEDDAALARLQAAIDASED